MYPDCDLTERQIFQSVKHDYFSKKRSGHFSSESLPATGKGRKLGISSPKILIKITCFFVSALTVVSLFVTQSSAQNNPLDDLTDGRRTGFFVGGGVEYGYTRFSVGGPDSYLVLIDDGLARGLSGKLGYATSENTAFYVTSFGTNLAPALGVMKFSQEHLGYYFNGVIGFMNQAGFIGETLDYNVDGRRIPWILGLGLGYEFRPHFMLEFMLGYSQLSVSRPNPRIGPWSRFEFDLSRIEFVASFNYLFY